MTPLKYYPLEMIYVNMELILVGHGNTAKREVFNVESIDLEKNTMVIINSENERRFVAYAGSTVQVATEANKRTPYSYFEYKQWASLG